jgi:murein DD-endopeptidase MepM/ murein hydrolase activator NlpD
VQRFPLPAKVNYSYESGFRPQHQGVDIFAPRHSPLLACESGTAWTTTDPKGGLVVYINGESGARYYYAHLESLADPGLITSSAEHPVRVEAGWEIGQVGTSGNADGRPPHCHFQIRRGDEVVDPFPELYAVDPHHRGTIPDPGVVDRFETGLGNFGKGMVDSLALMALLWVVINASKGR